MLGIRFGVQGQCELMFLTLGSTVLSFQLLGLRDSNLRSGSKACCLSFPQGLCFRACVGFRNFASLLQGKEFATVSVRCAFYCSELSLECLIAIPIQSQLPCDS